MRYINLHLHYITLHQLSWVSAKIDQGYQGEGLSVALTRDMARLIVENYIRN